MPLDNAIRSISSVSSRYNESYISYGKKTDELRAKKAYRESLVVVALFLFLSFTTALVLFYLEQKSFMDSLFESVSALTTTGLTAGITTIEMDIVSKIFLIVNMILGRFEIIAVLYLFIENKKIKTRGSEYLKHLHIPNKHQGDALK
jgi:trk system potassium uptake protein TrkH